LPSRQEQSHHADKEGLTSPSWEPGQSTCTRKKEGTVYKHRGGNLWESTHYFHFISEIGCKVNVVKDGEVGSVDLRMEENV
jgi:hypothetical protein